MGLETLRKGCRKDSQGYHLVGSLQVSIGFCMGAPFPHQDAKCGRTSSKSYQRSWRHCPRAALSWGLGSVGQIIKCVWNPTSLGREEMVVCPSAMAFPSPRAFPVRHRNVPSRCVHLNLLVLLVVG